MEELEIIITKNGDINISVNNIIGKKCIDITKDLENSLGTIIKREFKPEYYQETFINEQTDCKNIYNPDVTTN